MDQIVTFNQVVAGSIPAQITIKYQYVTDTALSVIIGMASVLASNFEGATFH